MSAELSSITDLKITPSIKMWVRNAIKVDFNIFSIGETNAVVKYRTVVKGQSWINIFHKTISCHIVWTITGEIPTFNFEKTLLSIPKNINLGDPTFNHLEDTYAQITLNNGHPISHYIRIPFHRNFECSKNNRRKIS